MNVVVLSRRRWHLVERGAVFEEKMSLREWVQAGQDLRSATEAVQWGIGDWVNFGGRFDPNLEKQPQAKYARALKITRYKYQTLRNFAYVANRFDLSRRRDMDWSHHAEVAQLETPEQERYLTLAIKRNWAVADLREAIRSANADSAQEQERGEGIEFVPSRCVGQLVNWLRRENWEGWNAERKAALRAELEPLMAIYRQCGRAIPGAVDDGTKGISLPVLS